MQPETTGTTTAGALPLELATLYPEGDGFLARRAKAARAKLLGGIDDVLRRALAPGETIRLAARGTRYFFAEYVFARAAASHHNRAALVLTDRRLLVIHLGRGGRAADIKLQVPLAAIRGTGRAFLSIWEIRLADGGRLRWFGIGRADRRRLEALLPAGAGPLDPRPSLEHLCPSCVRHVPGAVGATLTCPHEDCRIPLRDPRRAARLSALVPGLGDLYLRHHFYGALEFIGAMVMLGVAVAVALGAALDPDATSVAVAAALVVLLLAAPRAIDYALTLHMGRKGLVPLALSPAPGAQARNLPSFPRWSPLLFAAGIALAGGVGALLWDDVRDDAAARVATRLASEGRFDDALARWRALDARGGADTERRVRFALALLEGGDLEGADEVRETFADDAQAEAALADRWNAALAREQEALADYREGVKELLGGDEAAGWTRVDRAVTYFAHVRRPHLPASRAEVRAHLAMGLLREPLSAEDVEAAPRWLDGVAGAPAGEIAAVEAAYHSGRGDGAAARAALSGVDAATLPVRFRLLALEARARVAADDAARAAVRQAAEAFPRGELDEDDAGRLDALLAPAR